MGGRGLEARFNDHLLCEAHHDVVGTMRFENTCLIRAGRCYPLRMWISRQGWLGGPRRRQRGGASIGTHICRRRRWRKRPVDGAAAAPLCALSPTIWRASTWRGHPAAKTRGVDRRAPRDGDARGSRRVARASAHGAAGGGRRHGGGTAECATDSLEDGSATTTGLAVGGGVRERSVEAAHASYPTTRHSRHRLSQWPP